MTRDDGRPRPFGTVARVLAHTPARSAERRTGSGRSTVRRGVPTPGRVLSFPADRPCARPGEPVRRRGRIGAVPSVELRAIVEPFMLLLKDYRREFDQVDPTGRVRHYYEAFRCWLHEAGFQVSGLERLERARAFRRLGELAERAGDPVGAIRFYRAALASHDRVGVKRRLQALERAGWTAVGREIPLPPAPS